MRRVLAWCRRLGRRQPPAADADPRHELGRRGEELALQCLERAGIRCLERNVRLGDGEIDLICESAEGTIVFVEVKTRAGDEYPGERAINRAKKARLIRLAQRLARRRRWLDRRLRIDVVVIVWTGKGEPVVRHHPSAVTLDR